MKTLWESILDDEDTNIQAATNNLPNITAELLLKYIRGYGIHDRGLSGFYKYSTGQYTDKTVIIYRNCNVPRTDKQAKKLRDSIVNYFNQNGILVSGESSEASTTYSNIGRPIRMTIYRAHVGDIRNGIDVITKLYQGYESSDKTDAGVTIIFKLNSDDPLAKILCKELHVTDYNIKYSGVY